MTRIEFTHNLVNLLAAMMLENEHPIIDYVKRSDDEQMRLFLLGKSKCDGINKISAHQKGIAVDIYFIEEGKLSGPKRDFDFWHKYWESKGGKPEISWDRGHFE